MSYITDTLLTKELQRLSAEEGREETIKVVELRRPAVRFRAWFGLRSVDFAVSEDLLHSAPLSHVSKTYLEPLLAKVAG